MFSPSTLSVGCFAAEAREKGIKLEIMNVRDYSAPYDRLVSSVASAVMGGDRPMERNVYGNANGISESDICEFDKFKMDQVCTIIPIDTSSQYILSATLSQRLFFISAGITEFDFQRPHFFSTKWIREDIGRIQSEGHTIRRCKYVTSIFGHE